MLLLLSVHDDFRVIVGNVVVVVVHDVGRVPARRHRGWAGWAGLETLVVAHLGGRMSAPAVGRDPLTLTRGRRVIRRTRVQLVVH